MIVETYKGCKIRVVKGKGSRWGYIRIVLNGVDKGYYLDSDTGAIQSIKATIDYAEEIGTADARFGPEWYAPGTYDLCPEGHVTPVGGACGHPWCVAQRSTKDRR